MHSREARDEMVARVNAAFQKWRSFDKMPEIDNAKAMRMNLRVDVPALVKLDANDKVTGKSFPEIGYVEALYSICARGTPVGRNGNQILGKSL
jgi:hypothetical protein